MWRRKFIAGLAGTVAFPLAIRAQTPNRIYRLGHLAHSSNSEASSRQIILPELARLGFVEGRNLVFDARVGEPDALPGLMRELLADRPDAIVAIGPPATALAGAAVVVLGHVLNLPPTAMAVAGAAICFGIRFIAIRRGWQLPVAGRRQRSKLEVDAIDDQEYRPSTSSEDD